MGEFIEKIVSAYEGSKDSSLVALSRIVRTQDGARRFGVPIGTVITPKSPLDKIRKGDVPDSAKGRVKLLRSAKEGNSKLFAMRVAELRRAMDKLDTEAVRSLIHKLESSKDLPKSANYKMLREYLKKYLKQRESKTNNG